MQTKNDGHKFVVLHFKYSAERGHSGVRVRKSGAGADASVKMKELLKLKSDGHGKVRRHRAAVQLRRFVFPVA
jgi:hypothetical protein